MHCGYTIFWLALLGFMATLAWGAETQINATARAINNDPTSTARKNYRASHFWGRRAVPGAATSNRGYYGEDEDEDEDDGYYGSDSYGSDSYAPSYAPSYGSYAPQVIQIPQVQSYQPSYYLQAQQSSYGGGNYKKEKKKKKNPICCCYTLNCKEACIPTDGDLINTCACDLRCCRSYSSTNPGCFFITTPFVPPARRALLPGQSTTHRLEEFDDEENTEE